MVVRFLQAYNGDCILISFDGPEKEAKNILIDGGTSKTYQFKNKRQKQEAGSLQKVIQEIKGRRQHIDLLILTHVDGDHIDGILNWFSHDKEATDVVKKVWFNSGRLISEFFEQEEISENLLELEDTSNRDAGIQAGIKFEDFVEKHQLWDRKIIRAGQDFELFGLKIEIVSPDKKNLKRLLKKWKREALITDASMENDYHISLEKHMADKTYQRDPSVHNASSIGFVLTYQGKKLVFLGDARPDVIVKNLNGRGFNHNAPLEAELVKLSHHGSASNTTKELLELIETDNYIVSTNGSGHQHPHKKCLAGIIQHNPNATILFNYPERIDQIFSEEDRKMFPAFNTGEISTIIL